MVKTESVDIKAMKQHAFSMANGKDLERLRKIQFFQEYKQKNHKAYCDKTKVIKRS